MRQYYTNSLNNTKLPYHIAIIMDGNGRWAEKKRLLRVNGHLKGVEVAKDTVKFASELGIKYLTLYTFSRENWNRPKAEVNLLMGQLEKHLRNEAQNMLRDNVRFRAVGNISELPESVREAISEVESKTRANSGINLQLALSYSGREEILEACRGIAKKVKEGKLSLDSINEETMQNSLYTADIPDPDLLIRTSGEMRVSNFLLWQIAYTEIYISDVLWPDFTRGHLLDAIKDFQTRERRFGLTRKQISQVAG